jgi:uncharacterized protein YkwD
MKKTKPLLVLTFFILALGTALFFRQDISDLYYKFSLRLPEISENLANTIAKEIGKQIIAPPPLYAEKESPGSFLTKTGVIEWTNAQRSNQGLPPLKENNILDATALIKAQDMLKNQYFAHESLSGFGVGDLADNAGYKFIMIGENLALGNFENDQALVQAWMDSPGHRANILNDKYLEIGVAVIRGVYEGQSTWLAVQHFALPLSACPQSSPALQKQIESNQAEINNLQIVLADLEQELRSLRRRDREAYNQKVKEYNDLVSQYNALVNETKLMVSQYNYQVLLFNDCVSGK